MKKDGGKNTLQSFCEDYVISLLSEFENIDDEVKNVGKDYYLYDRTEWVKTEEDRYGINDNDGKTMIDDTDDETIRTHIIQKGLFNQIIHSKDGKVLDRHKRKILEIKDVRFE